MSYQDLLRRHARIAILRFLENAPRYTSNVAMLTAFLPRAGIAFTRDQVVTEVGWLAEQGMVETDDSQPGLVIVSATVRGVEIAQGVARHPEIQRPRPGV